LLHPGPFKFLPCPIQTFGLPALRRESFFQRPHRDGEIGFQRIVNVLPFNTGELADGIEIDVIPSQPLRIRHQIPKLSRIPLYGEIKLLDVRSLDFHTINFQFHGTNGDTYCLLRLILSSSSTHVES
jgi:hypothetical protein